MAHLHLAGMPSVGPRELGQQNGQRRPAGDRGGALNDGRRGLPSAAVRRSSHSGKHSCGVGCSTRGVGARLLSTFT